MFWGVGVTFGYWDQLKIFEIYKKNPKLFSIKDMDEVWIDASRFVERIGLRVICFSDPAMSKIKEILFN